MVSIFLRKAPNPNLQPAKYSLSPLLDLMEDSETVVLRCCTLWWQHIWVDASGRPVPFSAMVMTFSSEATTWCYDDFILLDTSACSRNVLFAYTSFNPAAFPITNILDVSYCTTPPGRHVIIDFVPYQMNSRAPDSCSFLWFGSEVDIVLVSISKMNHENKRVSVTTHQKRLTGVRDFQCQWNIILFHNHMWQDVLPEGLGIIACYLC